MVTMSSNPFRNPYNTDCVAPYKGPILPAVAVGGFLVDGQESYDSSDYIKATGLSITMMVNNWLDEEALAPALAWETKYGLYYFNTVRSIIISSLLSDTLNS